MEGPPLEVLFDDEEFNVDLLIVADALPAHPSIRMALLYEAIEPPLEPKGYTLVKPAYSWPRAGHTSWRRRNGALSSWTTWLQ